MARLDSVAEADGLPLMAAAEVQDGLIIARNDLDRLHRLLADASATLIGHFHAATEQLRALLEARIGRPADETAPLQRTLEHVAGAVTAMQFQDLASQLIEHTSRRLNGCADRLACQLMEDDGEGAAVIEPLPQRPNPVTQDEMDAGSVELF